MAYYPPDFVDRIRVIKRLQEERFMPLRLIKGVMDRGPEQAAALIEVEDRIVERAVEAQTGDGCRRPRRASATTSRRTSSTASPRSACSPDRRGYDRDDVLIIEAISRFRASGYDEAIGFTVYDTLPYREALQPLVEYEVRMLLERLAGEVPVDRAADIIARAPSRCAT